MDSVAICELLARAATTCRQLGCRLTPDSADLAPAHLTCSLHAHAYSSASAALIPQLCRLSAYCRSGQLHTILHFTAAAATTVAQLLISSHGHCTSDIISCNIH
jgi:hypothetical protein